MGIIYKPSKQIVSEVNASKSVNLFLIKVISCLDKNRFYYRWATTSREATQRLPLHKTVVSIELIDSLTPSQAELHGVLIDESEASSIATK